MPSTSTTSLASLLTPIILAVSGVQSCHKIRSRGRADDVQVDLHIQVDAQMRIVDAHAIAHCVKAQLIERFPQITDATIHIEPARAP